MRLAYTDQGHGPAVVLLHGSPLCREFWKEQIDGIGSIYRVIAPDLRGHGESPAPEGDYTIDEMADDVVELLDGLSLTMPVVVGGIALGGYVALSMLARYPDRVRGLMLMDTRAGADTPEAAAEREKAKQAILAAGRLGPEMEPMLPRQFARKTLEEQPERVTALRKLMERNTVTGIVAAMGAMARRPDRRAALATTRVPTLVLVGEEDAITPPAEAQEIAKITPGARLRVIPDAGHFAPYENYPVVNAEILQFLDGCIHD
jgi:pimeloyl-ACP methyl ester carboxylesterase